VGLAWSTLLAIAAYLLKNKVMDPLRVGWLQDADLPQE
jgi:hypothetical protein